MYSSTLWCYKKEQSLREIPSHWGTVHRGYFQMEEPICAVNFKKIIYQGQGDYDTNSESC